MINHRQHAALPRQETIIDTFKNSCRRVCVLGSLHGDTKSEKTVLVALLFEPFPNRKLRVESCVHSRFVRLLRESQFRIEEYILQICRRLEGLIRAIGMSDMIKIIASRGANQCPVAAATPRVPICFFSGLNCSDVNVCVKRSVGTLTYFAMIASTDFPVSNQEEIRLLAKTSGVTSTKIWFVASTRRIRASTSMNKLMIL